MYKNKTIKAISFIVILFIISLMCITGCSSKNKEAKRIEENLNPLLNNFEDNIGYNADVVKSSELELSDSVKFIEGYCVYPEDSEGKLFIGIYEYDNMQYIAGYGENCDVKTYLLLPELDTVEADTINQKDYTIAVYTDNSKLAYYYPNEDICVYIYSKDDYSMNDFKDIIKNMNVSFSEKNSLE